MYLFLPFVPPSFPSLSSDSQEDFWQLSIFITAFPIIFVFFSSFIPSSPTSPYDIPHLPPIICITKGCSSVIRDVYGTVRSSQAMANKSIKWCGAIQVCIMNTLYFIVQFLWKFVFSSCYWSLHIYLFEDFCEHLCLYDWLNLWCFFQNSASLYCRSITKNLI